MNKKIPALFALLILTIACVTIPMGEESPSQSEVETIVAGTLQAITSEADIISTPVVHSGTIISANSVTFVIPAGLGTGANVETIPEVSSQDFWDTAPAHSKFTLQGYPLQGKFFEPFILVYPAAEFEATNTGAAQSLQELRDLLVNPSAIASGDSMPAVPGFNAAQVFAAGKKIIAFQNGSGVRLLTQYAQYYATANNHELFYNFQGLTADGKFYLIGILPVNIPFLAPDDKPDSFVPADGVTVPANGPDEGYYAAITQKLDDAAGDAFTPALSSLDALFNSITVQ